MLLSQSPDIVAVNLRSSDSRSGEEAAAAAAIESGGSADVGGASDSPNVPQSPTRDYGLCIFFFFLFVFFFVVSWLLGSACV